MVFNFGLKVSVLYLSKSSLNFPCYSMEKLSQLQSQDNESASKLSHHSTRQPEISSEHKPRRKSSSIKSQSQKQVKT